MDGQSNDGQSIVIKNLRTCPRVGKFLLSPPASEKDRMDTVECAQSTILTIEGATPVTPSLSTSTGLWEWGMACLSARRFCLLWDQQEGSVIFIVSHIQP